MSKDKAARVSGIGYSGGMAFGAMPRVGAVAVDLAGLSMPPAVPLLEGHVNDFAFQLGEASPKLVKNQLLFDGLVAPVTDGALRVIGLARNGISFQASLGLNIISTRLIPAGKTISLNGQSLTAPDLGLLVVEQSELREISLTPLGADPNTSAQVNATHRNATMNPPDAAAPQAPAQVPHSLALASPTPATFQMPAAPNWPPPHASAPPAMQLAAPNEAEILARERARVESIDLACTGNWGPQAPRVAQLRQWAHGGQISMEVLQGELLGMMRAGRATGPAIHTPDYVSLASQPNILEGALLRFMGHENTGVKTLGADAMNRAGALRFSHLVDWLKMALDARGIPTTHDRQEMLELAFSTADISTLLSNSANKIAWAGYTAFPSLFQRMAKPLTANNFKDHTGAKLVGRNVALEEVGAAGELHHGNLQDNHYTYKVATYGKMYAITRQHMIDDDLSALAGIPAIIGRGAALKVEQIGMTLLLANTGTFFGTGNANYISGASSALSATSIASACEKILKMVDEDGNPILVRPAFLVVPPELQDTANGIYVSRTLNVGFGSTTANDRLPQENVMFGKYEPFPSPYLSNVNYAGYSTTAWYLFGDPADVAAFGLAYLNGVQSPTIQAADSDFNTLGIQMRGFLDFGVCQIDARGAVKSKGAA